MAFQPSARATINAGEWLPGLYPGMYHAYLAGGAPVGLPFLPGRNAFVAGSLTYMTVGETDIVNERGDYLGRVTVWRGAAAAHAGLELTDKLAAGLGLKLVRNSRYDWWSWELSTDGTSRAAWVPDLNAGVATAIDLAVLYRPASRFSMGAALDNVGPHLVYGHSGEADDLPRMIRLGASWTPVESRDVRLRVMPELDKLLVGMFYDTTGTKTFGRMLNEEWKDVWKALGVEMTAFGLVSIRLGYFEDLSNELGGLIYQREGWYSLQHYGLWDVITRRDIGQFKRIGLCWGFGVGTNTLRFDLSSDAAIYDFPNENWKFQLTSNDLGRLFGRRS